MSRKRIVCDLNNSLDRYTLNVVLLQKPVSPYSSPTSPRIRSQCYPRHRYDPLSACPQDPDSDPAHPCLHLPSAAPHRMADPYLTYRPSFAYSLPVQLLIQGITLTLLVVLLIHLLFTTQYHFPLSRFNYLLQLTGILLVLTNIIISIIATMRVQDKASQRWPYMLDYISVNLPNYDWTMAETAAWFTLHCACNGLVQVRVFLWALRNSY